MERKIRMKKARLSTCKLTHMNPSQEYLDANKGIIEDFLRDELLERVAKEIDKIVNSPAGIWKGKKFEL
jgi:hypothetical protein